MFCPGCGSEERQASQFCRACGTDLRVVRVSLERPDSVTASAVSAREDIGRAEEKRLRRLRIGVVTAAAGLGGAIFMAFMSAFIRDADALLGVSGLGVATFLIGIGLIINALYFTKPRNQLEDHSPDARAQNLLDAGYAPPAFKAQTTSNLAQTSGSSITEHTTHHLKPER